MTNIPPETLESEGAAVEQSLGVPAQELPTEARTAGDTRRRMLFIALGFMLVVYSYPDSGIGKLPLKFLMKDQLHYGAEAVAVWFFWVNIPSWCKPILAVFTDAVPFFGKRRQSYAVAGALMGALLWIVMGVVPHQFYPLLIVGFALNAMCTVGGTIHGATVVEESQRGGGSGRAISTRSVFGNLAAVIGGPLGGYLATRAFGWTAAVGAVILVALAALAYYCLQEPRQEGVRGQVLEKTKGQLSALKGSRVLWLAGALLFLRDLAPGFSTPLLYYQTDTLGFSKEFIGWLAGISSVASILGGVTYYFLAKRLNLRAVIILCILINGLAALAFLLYKSQGAALIIEAAYGWGGVLGFLCLFDAIARATPRGSEAMGYSIMYAFINVALSLSDVVGGRLFQIFHGHFAPLVLINAGTTLLILAGVPLLPARLTAGRDGEAVA